MEVTAGELLEDRTSAKTVSRVMAAMAHPIRMKILCLLIDNEMNVNEILAEVGSSQSNISQHLDALKGANLVQVRRSQQHSYYSLTHNETSRIILLVRDLFCPGHARLLRSRS
ncbi:MAG: winged helix-turn-helix transcriptional regulator [Gammaproteobacteria bacterium]|uniref:Winged helix-turn-helix transcriptional regulator n=1 Tax=Candidatus Thiopontia autotrophica TaxID=2841688 RepID=A0A8J6TQK6_9GAMM|nr:winged helix-turn-helix transcriptional regulator [Candidatus Thiopontia autotrophica]MBL6968856.1 winged helix-turn-helix transcriptional regulator [Gammaproteobacteria bacterium]